MRASAACGSSRASRPVMPGRCSDSAASSAPASAPGRPTGQHAVVDQAGGADRQRRLHDVVAAEDEVAERRRPGVGERRAHRDEPGRLGKPGGDRRRARHRGRRDRPAATDQPHPDAAIYVHTIGPFDTARA